MRYTGKMIITIDGKEFEMDGEFSIGNNLNTDTYDDGWPKRDSIPTSDPIGDVVEEENDYLDALRYTCASVQYNNDDDDFGTFDIDQLDPYVESYKKWKKDQEAYEKTMKPHLINPDGKSFDFDAGITFSEEEPKCDCGTFAVHGKVPLKAHAHYCKLVKLSKNE